MILSKIKFCTTKQAYRIYQSLAADKSTINESTIKQKLNALSVSNCLLNKIVKTDGIIKKSIYAIKKETLVFLNNNNWIADSELRKVKMLKNVTEHSLLAKEVLVNFIVSLECTTQSKFNNLHNHFDLYSYHRQNNLPFGSKNQIIPDEYIKNGNKKIYIEFDANSETLEILNKKIYRYINLAKSDPGNLHYICFSIIDNSMYNTITSNVMHYKREKNILHEIDKYQTLLDSVSNIEFLVTNLRESGDVIAEIFKEKNTSYRNFYEQLFYNNNKEVYWKGLNRKKEHSYFLKRFKDWTIVPNIVLQHISTGNKVLLDEYIVFHAHENDYKLIKLLDSLINSDISHNVKFLVLYPIRDVPRTIHLLDIYSNVLTYSYANDNLGFDTDVLYVRETDRILPSERNLVRFY